MPGEDGPALLFRHTWGTACDALTKGMCEGFATDVIEPLAAQVRLVLPLLLLLLLQRI